jgi:hypothetical protein
VQAWLLVLTGRSWLERTARMAVPREEDVR